MDLCDIGKNIARLRAKKGVTQEELARSVGISAQAVSKWENGGVPDAGLLPGIADFFEAPIDALFGRSAADHGGLENAIAREFSAVCESRARVELALRLCWRIEMALCGDEFGTTTLEALAQSLESTQQQWSRFICDDGYTLMGLGNRLSYFLLAPQAKDSDEALLRGIDYASLSSDLSDRTVLDAMILLNKRSSDKSFTAALLTKRLGIDEGAATEVIETLK